MLQPSYAATPNPETRPMLATLPTLAPIPSDALATACRHTEEHARDLAAFLSDESAANDAPHHRWYYVAAPVAPASRWYAVAAYDFDGRFLGAL